jgi:hypothetical protein
MRDLPAAIAASSIARFVTLLEPGGLTVADSGLAAGVIAISSAAKRALIPRESLLSFHFETGA